MVPSISRKCRITLMTAFFCSKKYNELQNSCFLLIEYLRDLHEIDENTYIYYAVGLFLEKSNLSILSISISALSNGKHYGGG